jgi:hypothetical protein
MLASLTSEQIKALQDMDDAIDWTGKPLTVDGNYGPRTQWWHGISKLHPVRQGILQCALAYHFDGTAETGLPNRSPVIDQMQEPGGLTPKYGHPWCLAFVSWCLTRAGADWPVYHMSAYKAIQWARANDRIVTNPLPGDVFCFLYPSESAKSPGAGHGGIVLGCDKDWIADVDGNVGNAVRVGRRARAGLTFIRTVQENPGQLTMPTNLDRLDGAGDR